jgi:Domain of unknown function (DUF4394)
MPSKSLTSIAAAAVLLTLAACGGNDYDTPRTPAPPPPAPAPAPVQVGDTIVLTASGTLVSFNRAAPGTTVGSVSVSGLSSGEALIGIDLRPADGLLYALSNQSRVYTVDPSTGAATLKSTLAADPADTTDPFGALAGTQFGVDFNPTVDRLRVVSNSGQNLRINVDSGATTTDTVLSLAGATPTVVAAAYSNNFDGANATQLFDLNAADGNLYVQAPPNDGVLSTAPTAPVPLGVAFSSAADIDIDAVDNVGYAVLTAGGATQLYSIDLRATSNAATAVAAIGVNEPVVGLVVNRRAPAATVFALTTDNRLMSVNPRTPNTVAATATLAAPAGEEVVGIDVRPIDGLLYALTRAGDNSGRVYTVNESSGAMSLVATLNTALSGTVFSVDFNPMANALRVISDTGQSLAVNLTTAPGTVTANGAINSATIPTPSVIAAAYLNSGVNATPPTATTLFSMEASTDVLATQVPATGTLTTVGPLGRDIAGMAGFDIAGSRNGLALAAFAAAGMAPYTLFEVNVATGATALPRGLTADTARIGGAGGPALRDIAIRF